MPRGEGAEGRGAAPRPQSFGLTPEATLGPFLSLPGTLSPPQGCCFVDPVLYLIFITFILYTVNRSFRLIKASCSPHSSSPTKPVY